MLKLSIVIPCYNEEKRIESTLKKIIEFCSKNVNTYEIIVVDDGSTDKTSDILKNYDIRILHNVRNKGKGFAVKIGMLEAKYDYVLFTDADLSTPIEFVRDLIARIGAYDVVIASRNLPNSRRPIEQGNIRQILGRSYPLLCNLLLHLDIKDTQCGFKLFRKKAASQIFSRQRISGFAFDAELMFIAKKLGYKIREVAVDWYNDEDSKVQIVIDPLKMFLDLLRIRKNNLIGMYN